MTLFDVTAEHCMRKPVITVSKSASLVDVDTALRANGISSVPIVDEHNQALGILSRTDLMTCGRVSRRYDGRPHALSLPDLTAGEKMRPGIITVQATDPLPYTTKRMVNAGVHRVYVSGNDQLVGVLSAVELLSVIAGRSFAPPIRDLMTTPVQTVGAWVPLAEATEQLKQSAVSALVVVESSGWPVGTFSQRDALGTQGLDPAMGVGVVMGRGVLALDGSTPQSSAAAQSLASGFRWILVLHALPTPTTPPSDSVVPPERILGIVTGLDFARAIL